MLCFYVADETVIVIVGVKKQAYFKFYPQVDFSMVGTPKASSGIISEATVSHTPGTGRTGALDTGKSTDVCGNLETLIHLDTVIESTELLNEIKLGQNEG